MATRSKDKDKDNSAAMEDEKQQKGSKTATKNQETETADDSHEIDESEELDALLEMFEEGDLTSIDPEIAGEMIEEWQDILAESEDSELKEIGGHLKQLKKAISLKKPKVEEISEMLSQLGEQVNTSADNAKRGYKGKLHKLAKALTKAGRSLEQESADEEE
ncbi:MAG: hypothetical protein MUF49_14595 [Oculatellaceae cyanobacterium Prado106]|jgi:hypothetical protein|nr:hypothetical protein [Oculatellaceae cyanobacterium Prado106]